jgi:hypothetical protein
MDKVACINAVINTLEGVSVSGSDNWSKMLGCVQALRQVCEELKEDGSGKTAEQSGDPEAGTGAV